MCYVLLLHTLPVVQRLLPGCAHRSNALLWAYSEQFAAALQPATNNPSYSPRLHDVLARRQLAGARQEGLN